MHYTIPDLRLGKATGLVLVLALAAGATTPSWAQARRTSPYQAAHTLPPRLTALDSLNGFRTYTFGTRLGDWPPPLPSLHKTRRGQLVATYPAEPVVVGDLILRGLQLRFYNGRLAGLLVAPTSEAYATELLRVLQAQYGPGQPAGRDRVVWRGQVVTLVYELLITNIGAGRHVESIKQGQVSLLSNTLWAEAEAEKVLP